MLEPRCRWVLPPAIDPDPEILGPGAARGLSPRLTGLLARRGTAGSAALDRYFGPPAAGLNDPAELPDAAVLRERLRLAAGRGERVLVFGDFDADGLTGLAIVVRTLRALGIDAVPYVPSRVGEGHGLSLAAVETAAAGGATVIVTVDCGSSSRVEVAAAQARGIDVLVTDHHRVPPERPPAIALVNPHRPEATYPDRRLSGAGIAFALARLLLRDTPAGEPAALRLADLAAIGTIADVAPLVGENRAIVRLGLERLAADPVAGLAALRERLGERGGRIDVATIAFAIAPRINAAGRVGDAGLAARLLLTDDPAEAAGLAGELEAANRSRRDQTREVVAAARELMERGPADAPAIVVRGPWPVGIIGLAAGRVAEVAGVPAVLAAEAEGSLRGSVRGDGTVDLAGTLERLGDLFIRHGGHAAAAGFELAPERWAEFEARFLALAAESMPADRRPLLEIDLVAPAIDVDYDLQRDLARLAPTGPGNPDPVVAVIDAEIVRARATQGGHTQLVVRRRLDVIDGIAFERPDLAAALEPGARADLAVRVASRVFAGLETLQLEVVDAAPAGTVRGRGSVAAAVGASR